MSADPDPSLPAPSTTPLREVRYSLRRMLEQVDAERIDTAIGQEKLEQGDISKLFRRQPAKNRAPGS
ncbi:MAG: hypothetical protein Q7P63_10055 [Verrucomicrobiota bacterium JB022]|nr:hypothetical protein [Verrucomicrobiota bacterium JB022]